MISNQFCYSPYLNWIDFGSFPFHYTSLFHFWIETVTHDWFVFYVGWIGSIGQKMGFSACSATNDNPPFGVKWSSPPKQERELVFSSSWRSSICPGRLSFLNRTFILFSKSISATLQPPHSIGTNASCRNLQYGKSGYVLTKSRSASSSIKWRSSLVRRLPDGIWSPKMGYQSPGIQGGKGEERLY